MVSLRLILEADLISSFTSLLGHGFYLQAEVGCTIRELLCDQLGWDHNYIDHRIQTLFLDGCLVDDIDRAIVQDDSSLALSGAMPGLLGAALRKGGRYSPMRSEISYKPDLDPVSRSEGRVKLKLFNFPAREQGIVLLETGVCFQGKTLHSFFMNRGDGFWARCREIKIDAKEVVAEQLLAMNWEGREVFLQIRTMENY